MAEQACLRNPAEFCTECSGMEKAIMNLEKSDHEQWEELKTIKNMLLGTLVSTILSLVGIIATLAIIAMDL